MIAKFHWKQLAQVNYRLIYYKIQSAIYWNDFVLNYQIQLQYNTSSLAGNSFNLFRFCFNSIASQFCTPLDHFLSTDVIKRIFYKDRYLFTFIFCKLKTTLCEHLKFLFIATKYVKSIHNQRVK